MKPTLSFILSVLFFLVFVTGCSASNQPNQQAPDFSLQLAVEQLSVKQGETGTLRIMIQKTGAFNTPVALTLAENPAGVTGTFDPASTSDESTLTLSVAASAAAGESTLTLTGTAGNLVKTATLQLTVIENITLELTIAGLPADVAANVVVTGPNAFQQTLSTSTTLSGLTPGTYSFAVNDVKPDSATFSKTAGPSELEFTAQRDESITLTYGCSLVTPPDANLDTVLKTATAKATYNCADLAALTTLDASNKAIQNIEGLQYAVGLTSLDLEGNQLTRLPENIFDNMTALTNLKLRSNQLGSLSEGIFDNMTALTELDLAFTNLSSLPATIFSNLTSLTKLDLSNNKLSSLPTTVFDNMAALTVFAFSGNQLSSLPETIFDNVTTLTLLDLNFNELTSLPENIFDNLTNLTDIGLVGNQLSSLPQTVFDNLIALTSLDLEENCLEAFKVPTKGQLAALDSRVTFFRADDNPKAGCAAVLQPATFSNFDTTTEGWTVTVDGVFLTHVATGGSPGGFIQASDGGLGSTWYWKAPALYYGDASDYIGKTLKFSLKQSATDSPFTDIDVGLVTAAQTFTASLPNPPGNSFTDYSIDLSPANFSPALSLLDFSNALKSLESLEIRGEYRTGADTGGLDSVSFGE